MAQDPTTPSNATIIPSGEQEEADSSVSPFLRFQDPNGDKLPDVCDLEIAAAEQVCKDCIPNPRAIVKDWRKTDQNSPFLNEKLCKYQITFETPETTTGFVEGMSEQESTDALAEIYEKYSEPAVIALLEGFQKDTSRGVVLQVLEALEFTSFDLDTRPSSRLKLLYSVDFPQVFSLPDEDLTDGDEENEDDKINVTFETTGLSATNIRIRKGLNLYGRFFKVARAVEGKVIRFEESNKIFNFEDYGDDALFLGKSPVGELLQELDSWLNSRGYNITGVAGGFLSGLGDDRVQKLDFVFSQEYQLIKLKVYTQACGTTRPDVVYGRRLLKTLNSTSPWRDKTAVSYFAKMKQIEQDVTARVPIPFEEFIVKHTYPKVFIETAGGDSSTATFGSCVADALANDAKELGQDIFDEVFSLADAIAYKFHKNLCQTDPSEVNEENLLKGLNIGAGPGPQADVYGMAKAQAFDTINAEDSAFAQMCFRMISIGQSGVECGLSPIQQLDQMYAQGLDRIAICGLMDLMLEAMQCLFKGLTLEEALASIVRSALNAMGVTQIGELFVGLPPDKQRELERLVNQKLESGDIFSEGSPGQATSDIIARKQEAPDAAILKKFKGKKPWNDKKFVEQQEENLRPDNYGNLVPSKVPRNPSDDLRERRTIGQKLQAPLGDDYQTNNIILNAYIEAYMEVYQDNYLVLIDALNKFPGAQMISSIIAFLDCPTPPLFNPGFDDFFKSLQLPFCRNTAPISFPKWENPFLYIPKLNDILAAIFEALKKLVLCIIMRVIVLVLAKVCEIIGDAICKALEVAGQVTAGLLTGNTNVGDIMRETVCGPDADEETINNTILDLMENFGVGGAAFADPERSIAFFGDIVNNSTREESLTMFIDGPNQSQINIIQTLIRNDYTEFEDALPNPPAIERMIRNIGNVVPAQTKDEIRQALDLASGELMLPMNPTLCSTPEELENFERVRCDLLEGRMSPAQCRAQSQRARDQVLENANDINRAINEGIGSVLENEMPPIFSDPNCENGLLPYEPQESIKTATGALKGDMESLQIAFTDDMLGNGGLFANDDDWGMINMILSDTFANPYTAHQRKVFNSDRFVDFYIPNEAEDDDNQFPREQRQRGAYPFYVAEWLKYQFTGEKGANDLAGSLEQGFKGTNDTQKAEIIKRTFNDLGFAGLFDTDVNLTELQDFGYNTTIDVDYETEIVNITREARKKTPDLRMKFRDNSKGYRPTDGNYAYGFNLNAYYSDIVEINDDIRTGFYNLPNDNIRIKIFELLNTNAKTSVSFEEKVNDVDETTASDASILSYQKYEFFAVDNTLDNIEVTQAEYPQLFDAFVNSKQQYSPQVYALSDLTGLGPAGCKAVYDNHNSEIIKTIGQTIGNNEEVWLYGATFDDLQSQDYDYGVQLTRGDAPYNDGDAGDFVLYEDYKVPDYDNDGRPTGDTRDVSNDDAVLGISRNAYRNRNNPDKIRVHYLNPNQFGQNYMSPALYVKPTTNKGWLGAINLMFPEYTPCKPRETNLISFDSIQAKIDEVYPRIPEDKRLKSDPDCVLEVPFNRILTRPSKAGLEALITAAIRIFASTHYIKSTPTFATFAPKFGENYSNIYAAYIVEVMEESSKDAGGNFLSPFKDDEFWFAFLEQAVQAYSRRLDDDLDESITPENVPVAVQEAIERINVMQENYDQPSPKEFRNAPSQEKGIFQTLKGFREEKNLEAIQQVEEDAKLILQELVKEQLTIVGDIFSENLRGAGFTPNVVNSDYYVLQQFADGGSDLNLQGATSFVEQIDNAEIEAVKESGTAGYTTGNLFALPDGTSYIGEYHYHVAQQGSDEQFMVGAEHVPDGNQEVLTPFGTNVVVGSKDTDGNVQLFGDVKNIGDTSISSSKLFYIRKFVSINGEKMNTVNAQQTIRARGTGNISDFYPGTLTFVTKQNTSQKIGIEGNIGVQHGLEFGVVNGGTSNKITEVLIDALDLPVSEFKGPQANSKLLLCLLDNLRDDPKFRLTVDYIFSMKKALSINAIYNDIAFLPSIGEFTVSKGDYKGDLNGGNKPGVSVSVDADGNLNTDFNPGWAHESDRNKLFASPFFKKWDEWDQLLLRKSMRRIKKIFRPYYRKRKFEVEDIIDAGPGEQFLNNAKARFTPLPGGNTIPWAKRRKLKPNPFNSKGQLCKKPD
jgi:hypothetical protein